MFSILVVEGEEVITRCIEDHLGEEGYQAVTFFDGKNAVQYALREIPSLIILDATYPGADCFEVIQHLREHPKCMHVPIMLVSSRASLIEKVRAYESGVDSYITCPFPVEELLANIRCLLRRMQQITLSPLTRLPGGLQLERAIDYKLRRGEPWSILYLDLDNFKAFNDAYGFLAGNDMILMVSQICQEVVYANGNADDFVGHIGGDDFMVVTTPEREVALCREIQARYKEESQALYRREDLERGSVYGVDRKGRPFQFPLVTLSIGVISDHSCNRHSRAVDDVLSLAREVGFRTAEVKRHAKNTSNHISRDSLMKSNNVRHALREAGNAYRLYDRFHTFWSAQSCSPTCPTALLSCSQKPIMHLKAAQFSEEEVLAEFR